jgi:hypothetical protein
MAAVTGVLLATRTGVGAFGGESGGVHGGAGRGDVGGATLAGRGRLPVSLRHRAGDGASLPAVPPGSPRRGTRYRTSPDQGVGRRGPRRVRVLGA